MKIDDESVYIFRGVFIAFILGLIVIIINKVTGFGGIRVMNIAYAATTLSTIFFIWAGIRFFIEYHNRNK